MLPGVGMTAKQRDIVKFIRVRLDNERVCTVELCLQRRSQCPVFAGLDPLGTKHQEHGVVRLRPGSRQLIDLGQGDLWQELLVQLPLSFDAGDRWSAEEVIPEFTCELRRLQLIALLV